MRRSQAGQGPTAALNQGVKLTVLREDLRRRKRQHVDTCLEWRQYIATWEQEWQREELKLDAIAMLAATPAPAAQTTPALGGGPEEIARRLDEDAERRREARAAARAAVKHAVGTAACYAAGKAVGYAAGPRGDSGAAGSADAERGAPALALGRDVRRAVLGPAHVPG